MLVECAEIPQQLKWEYLTEVDEWELTELLVHWVIHKGLIGLKYILKRGKVKK